MVYFSEHIDQDFAPSAAKPQRIATAL